MNSTIEITGCETAVLFGCSVTGPGNIKRGTACQDAWGRRSWQVPEGVAHAIAIADGMGSKSESRTGARAAKGCALKAARRWTDYPSVGTDWLIRWLEAEWRYSLGTHAPKDCCATCWLIATAPGRGILVMGLGDGFALLSSKGGVTECISGRKPGDFTNETVALGTPHKASDWQVRELPEAEMSWTAVLATDGVAEDLRADKLDSFLSWTQSMGVLRNPSRGLRRSLERWPVKAHTDDKTIAVILMKRPLAD